MNDSQITERPGLPALFRANFKLSAFTFGGGYAIVAMMKNDFVQKYHWISEEEMMDLCAAAQSAPGAVAINTAAASGYLLAGVPGMIVSAIAAALPPFLIMILITPVYQVFQQSALLQWFLDGVLAGVSALIVSAALDYLLPMIRNKQILQLLLFGICFLASLFLNLQPWAIILICLAVGLIRAAVEAKR